MSALENRICELLALVSPYTSLVTEVAMKRPKNTMNTADNHSVYAKAHKTHTTNLDGRCDRCPWHDGESPATPPRV